MGTINIRFISNDDAKALLNWAEVISCLTSAYSSWTKPEAAPPRVVARETSAWLRVMAAVPSSGRYMGTKVISRARVRRSSYLIALWEQETGELVGILDGQHITAMRTAGTSAMAVDLLAPKQELNVGVLGTGAEAAAHLTAMSIVRPLKSVKVFSPTEQNRRRFAEKFRNELNVDCCAVSSAAEAVATTDLVIAAARSHNESPIIDGTWLRPGMTVVSVGSTLPEQRELDIETIRRADRIVADVPEEVINETGDMLAARDAEIPFLQKITSLVDLVRGICPGRQHRDEIVLFKSIGSSLQDIAVSELCFKKACENGLGVLVPIGLTMKGKVRSEMNNVS